MTRRSLAGIIVARAAAARNAKGNCVAAQRPLDATISAPPPVDGLPPVDS